MMRMEPDSLQPACYIVEALVSTCRLLWVSFTQARFWRLYLNQHTQDAMFAIAAEHPILAAVLVLLAGGLIRGVLKGYAVRRTFHDQVCCMADVISHRPLADSVIGWSTALMAMGSSQGDGRHDGRQPSHYGPSSW
jgi:hypothetical protein